MRTRCATLPVLIVLCLPLLPATLHAQPDEAFRQELIPDRREVSRAERLRTAQDPVDPDTVWIGHIHDPAFTAGGTMPAGGYGPYKVGRGPNRPMKSGGTIGGNGMWDFDRFQPGETDSLQGWWPLSKPFQSGATLFPDYRYAFFGLDYGNQVNYAINQGAPKRTFGVVGLWHRDAGSFATGSPDSIPGTNVQPVLWPPTEVGGPGSTYSAWMGMRSHGDLSHRDELGLGGTGNPFSAAVFDHQGNNGFNRIGSLALNGTDHNFPGYGPQMDQMLYRDIALGEGDGLTLAFNFSTTMSTEKNTNAGVRIGWFDKDPISVAQLNPGAGATPTNDGNFISAALAGSNAPCDSFMVYVGAPVDDDAVTFSAPLVVGATTITTVYDRKRRWLSEVLKLNGPCTTGSPCSIIGKELASYAGIHPPTAVFVDVGALYPAALQAIKDADGSTGDGGRVRVVFRVKTNRGWDDANHGNPAASFDSGTRGAAIVDNVVVNGWAAANGDFEAAGAINNDTAVDAVDAWKSTGKPPGVHFHVHSVTGLAFNDPCGGLDNPNRQCNLYGNVATSGDHDLNEKDGGLFGSNTQDRHRWFASPTINLRAAGNGPGFYNGMGIDDEVAITTNDYFAYYSHYNAGMVQATTMTGNFIDVHWQSYPARQANGNLKWGETRQTAGLFSYGTRACFETFAPGGGAKAQGLIRTVNAQNRPDSLRVYIHRTARCYTFNLTEATCAPTTGDFVGTYFDNISVALIDGSAPAAISFAIWNQINDAFPANGDVAMLAGGFDTTAAHLRIALNLTSLTGNTARPSVTGDSMTVEAGGADQRLDMVFRILPGPGNYTTIGSRSSGVSRRPDGKPSGTVAATPGDGSFFGEYMANAGEFGSSATHPGGVWDEHIWNSARMDTAERNLFPTANNASVVGLLPGTWAGTYHESDPRYPTLGITKHRCVMPVPSGAANSTNILCDGTGWGNYGAGSGWDGVTTTREYTKIIPDGLLTPGAHVQYFFRRSDLSSPTVHTLAPDTNFILQPAEGSSDGHRWQQFGVLPDRWKDGAWSAADRHAPAPACMLYVDWCDRRGDERLWVGIADSIGATAPERYGAHNGWHARGDQDATVSLQTVIGTADDWGVYAHGGQPGTIWDMYGVKGAETSTTSSSFANRMATPATGHMAGKDTRTGPTPEMLRQFYRILFALTGDLGAGLIGPYNDKGDNDVLLLEGFASGGSGTAQPRMVWFQGTDFVSGQAGGASGHPAFLASFFGATLVSTSYRTYSGNTADVIDLTPFAPISNGGSRYSLANSCASGHDVLGTTGGFGAAMAAKYPDTGTGANPKIASVYAPSSLPAPDHPAITLVDGWRTRSLGTWNTLTSNGRISYFHEAMSNLFGALNCALAPGGPVSAGEDPNRAPVDFLGIGSENPLRGGSARLTFGLARKEKVELRVYDVAGRTVRTLANRAFGAGEHALEWDGRDDAGGAVPSGVYFYQLRTPSFVGQRKLAVLRR